jgi:protein O-mannosyl-transferase
MPMQSGASRASWQASAALLVAVTFLAYWPVASAGFVFDDQDLVIDNPCISATDGLYRIWFTPDNYEYLPLTYSGFWLQRWLWGTSPLGYHLVSVALQALNALLLWRLLQALSISGAWWGAMLFAVHPVAASSVAWISEQKNLWGLLFALLSLLAFLKFEALASRRWYILSVAFFVAALFGKTSLVMMPCLILVYGWRQAGTLRIKDAVRVAPFILASLILGLTTVWFQFRGIADEKIPIGTLPERLAAAGYVVWFYLAKGLAPFPLSMIYPQWNYAQITYWPITALVVFLALLWRYRRSWKWGQACWLALGCYVLILAPVLGFLPMAFMRFSLVADHFQYPALPALTALAGAVSAWAISRRRAAALVTGTVVAAFLFLTMQQAMTYGNEETLWRTTIRQNPETWMAHSNLGKVLRDRGDNKAALESFATGIRLKPDDLNLRLLFGAALWEQGDLPGAADQYRQAIQIKGDDVRAFNNLAESLLLQGKADEALAPARRAVELRRDRAEHHVNLAWALNDLNRPAEAAEESQSALSLAPSFAEAHLQLARARLSMGDAAGAEAEFRETLRLDPTLFRAHNDLASILNRQGQPLEAAKHAKAALALAPNLAQAHFNLGNAYALQSMLVEAEQEYREAIRLDPDYVEAQNNLRAILKPR